MQGSYNLAQETIASTTAHSNAVPTEWQKAATSTRRVGPGKLDHTDLQAVKGFTNKQRAHLLKAGFTTTTEILYTPLSSLSKKLKVSQTECREIISCIVNERLPAPSPSKAGAIFSSASVADRLVHQRDQEDGDGTVLSTGQKALDDLLGGGIRTGTLTEVAGEAASGKTAFALQLSLQVQLPPTQGGLSGSCAYLSSEGNFPSQRLLDIASTYSCWKGSDEDVQRATDNVHLLHCSEVEPLLHAVRYTLPALPEMQLNDKEEEEVLPEGIGTQMVPSSNQADYRDTDLLLPPTQVPPQHQIPSLCPPGAEKPKPVKLIIVDSIAAPFRGAEGSGSSTHHFSDRTRDLAEVASLLHRLAQRYNLAVVLINQVSDVMSSTSSLESNNKQNHIEEQKSLNDGFPLDYRQYAHASKFFSGESAGNGGKMAVFGLAWANLINARVMLTRTGKRRRISDGREVEYIHTVEMDGDGGEINRMNIDSEEVRRMDIVFSPFAELGYTEYVLRQEGLVGVGTVHRTPRGVKAHSADGETVDQEGAEPVRASGVTSIDSQADEEEDEEAALWKGLSSDPAFEEDQ